MANVPYSRLFEAAIHLELIWQTISENTYKDFGYSDDHKTITFEMLWSIFNKPGIKYFIMLENNAIRNMITKQALIGIPNKVWSFQTGGKHTIII